MKKKPSSLSIFQILRQNTSIKSAKPPKQTSLPRKKSLGEASNEEKSSLTQLKMIKSSQKYNTSDSESLSDKEDDMKEIESATRRRKGSMDSFLRQEKEIKKKLHLKQEKIHQLIRKEKIIVEGDETVKPVSNFTKMIRKFNLDENIIKNLKGAGFRKPTAVQKIAIPAMFKVFFL